MSERCTQPPNRLTPKNPDSAHGSGFEYHRDLATIARRKSAIFEGMRPGGVAVLNREMAEWARVHMAARSRGLRAINYGRTPECEVRLIGYDPSSRIAEARIGSRNVAFALGAAGEHMALNALAVLAALWALGRDLEPALSRLATFAPLEGRGREFEAEIEGRRVLVLDEAYNANPGSMEAALALLGTKTGAARRIAVLGEMAELGPDAGSYHTRLAAVVARQPIDRVYALGPLYDEFWLELPEEIRADRPLDLQSLRSSLLDDLKNGDAVLFKGSHSTAMHKLVSDIASAKEGSIA